MAMNQRQMQKPAMEATMTRARKVSVRIAAAVAILLGSLTAPATAQQADENPLLDPVAMKKLQAFSDFMGKLDFFAFTAVNSFDELEPGGVRIKRFSKTEMVIDRPDKMAFHLNFDNSTSRKVWFKDGQITSASIEGKNYFRRQVPRTLDELFVHMEEKFNVSPPMADFLVSDIFAVHGKDLLSAIYLGERLINGRKLDHLSFESRGADWQIWLDVGEKPLPRRAEIEFFVGDATLQYSTQFLEWNLEVFHTGTVFDFFPSSDWTETEPPAGKP
jgi:hypothetical protein